VRPRSKRKRTRAVDAKPIGKHTLHVRTSARVDTEVKRSKVKVTRLRRPSQMRGCLTTEGWPPAATVLCCCRRQTAVCLACAVYLLQSPCRKVHFNMYKLRDIHSLLTRVPRQSQIADFPPVSNSQRVLLLICTVKQNVVVSQLWNTYDTP